MSFGKVANCLLAALVTLTNGMPQNNDRMPPQETPDSPPFLQFTNGGIRVNLGGYHAEAGLGGLLRGEPGGGLHASVGTPWGAHAGAGLGGQLGSQDGNLGGGLYARAGLGRGRPEAAAGLGGSIDGSGRSLNPISGGLYAGATPGGGPGNGVFLGGGVARDGVLIDDVAADPRVATVGPVNAANDTTTTTPRSRTNIQIIRNRSRDAQREQKVASKTAVLPADAEEKKPQSNEVRRSLHYAPSLAKIAVVGAFPAPAVPAVATVQKNVIVAAPAVPVVVASAAPAISVMQVENPVVEVAKPVYPRWYFRKRFWSVPRKTVYVAPTAMDIQGASSNAVVIGEGGGAVIAGKTAFASGSVFDDIFNIPISTLTAVNRLVNNFG